jgi:hypothetical protein
MPFYIAIPESTSPITARCTWVDGGPTPSRFARVVALQGPVGSSLPAPQSIRLLRSLLTGVEYTETQRAWPPVPVKEAVIGIRLNFSRLV